MQTPRPTRTPRTCPFLLLNQIDTMSVERLNQCDNNDCAIAANKDNIPRDMLGLLPVLGFSSKVPDLQNSMTTLIMTFSFSWSFMGSLTVVFQAKCGCSPQKAGSLFSPCSESVRKEVSYSSRDQHQESVSSEISWGRPWPSAVGMLPVTCVKKLEENHVEGGLEVEWSFHCVEWC